MRTRQKKVAVQNEFVKQDVDIFAGIGGLIEGKPVAVRHATSGGVVQLERAPNPIVFIESEKFLAGPILYPTQYEIVRDFFELLCPHCNKMEQIRWTPRVDQVLFEYDVCPQCGLKKLDIVDQLHWYNEMIGVMGMRSGKSALIASICAAITHDILCIDNIQTRLGIIKNQELVGTFIAAAGAQTSETVWGQFLSLYQGSPWFLEYKNNLASLEVTDPKYRRGDLYREADRSIVWNDRKIRLQASTTNAASAAGRTRIFAVIDELSRLDSGGSKRSATEVYRVTNNSMLTLRATVQRLREKGVYDVPDGKMFCVSSPIFADDKSMLLLKQAETQEKMFAFKKATWEANPTIKKEDLAEFYEKDPVGAERDYGANPPGAENPLITDPKLIEICIDKDRPSMFTPREVFFEREVNGTKFKYISVDVGGQIQFRNLAEYVIHCDPGKTKDSFCLGIGHKDEDTVIIDGGIEMRPIPPGNRQGLDPRKVYFPAVVDLIIKLHNVMSIRVVTYDNWNSEEQIQRLRDVGILAVGRDINREDYMRFVRNMEAGHVRFPKKEAENIDPQVARNMPCAKALWELLRLNDDGMRVDHPANGSSDMVQCYVGVHRALVTPEVIFSSAEMKNQHTMSRNVQMRKSMGKRSAVGRVVQFRWGGSGPKQ